MPHYGNHLSDGLTQSQISWGGFWFGCLFILRCNYPQCCHMLRCYFELNQCPKGDGYAALPQVKANTWSYCSVPQRMQTNTRRPCNPKSHASVGWAHLWVIRRLALLVAVSFRLGKLWPLLWSTRTRAVREGRSHSSAASSSPGRQRAADWDRAGKTCAFLPIWDSPERAKLAMAELISCFTGPWCSSQWCSGLGCRSGIWRCRGQRFAPAGKGRRKKVQFFCFHLRRASKVGCRSKSFFFFCSWIQPGEYRDASG